MSTILVWGSYTFCLVPYAVLIALACPLKDVGQGIVLPEWMDERKAARMAQLRALGWSQARIAQDVGVSQQTVSRYLRGIEEAAEESDDLNAFFLGLLIGGLGVALAAYLAREK
jgi:hypothetical protein